MLSRRIAPAAGAFSGLVAAQRRFDHERWYGHVLSLDACNYKYTGEPPEWLRPKQRAGEELRHAEELLPKIQFATTYECLLRNADRLNIHLNRKEFGNEIKFRLEKQANLVARGQQLIKSGQFPDQKTEDIMIARIADEEHLQAEMKYVKTIRANEVAEDNRLDILPGGSPNSLREKTRWNVNAELHPLDRGEIGARLSAWLPEKYHIVYFDDFQTVAANNEQARAEMKAIIQNVKKEHLEEAKAGGWEADLNEVIAELEEEVDPTDKITKKAIKECTSLDQLEAWSRLIHEYNGDDRILDIYERAAELTKNAEHAALVKQLRTLSVKMPAK
jgi:hypothetical protein